MFVCEENSVAMALKEKIGDNGEKVEAKKREENLLKV